MASENHKLVTVSHLKDVMEASNAAIDDMLNSGPKHQNVCESEYAALKSTEKENGDVFFVDPDPNYTELPQITVFNRNTGEIVAEVRSAEDTSKNVPSGSSLDDVMGQIEEYDFPVKVVLGRGQIVRQLNRVWLNKTQVQEIHIECSGFVDDTIVGQRVCEGGYLQKVTVGRGITKLDTSFPSCTGMSEIILSEGLVEIGEETFESAGEVRSVTIPNGVTTIGRRAFSNCSKLSSIELPETLKDIGDGAFMSTALESVTLPRSVKSMGNMIFMYCNQLTSLKIHYLDEASKLQVPENKWGFSGEIEWVLDEE